MVGLRVRLLNVIVPEVRVTLALGLKTTVEVPAVKVPERVKSVLEVPVSVMVEPFAVSVPAEAMFRLPVERARLEPVVSRVDKAELVPVMVVVAVAATVIFAPILAVRRKALAASGLIVRLPLTVQAPEPVL